VLFGFPAALVEAIRGAGDQAEEDFGVWPENRDTVVAFAAITTQWRVVALSTMERARIHYVGLDYAGARAGLEAEGIAVTPELWAGIRTMEAAARALLNQAG